MINGLLVIHICTCVSLSMCTTYMQETMGVKRGHWVPEPVVEPVVVSEPLCGYWELNMDPLQEQ